MSVEQIQDEIDRAWDSKSIKMDWLGMEKAIRDVYSLDLLDSTKLRLIHDILAAFTKRG